MTSVGNDMLHPLCTSQHSGRFRFAGIGAEAVWYGLQEIMVCWEGVWLRAQCTATHAICSAAQKGCLKLDGPKTSQDASPVTGKPADLPVC